MNFANHKHFAPAERAPTRRERRALKRRAGATVLLQNVVGDVLGKPRALNRRRQLLSSILARHAPKGRPYIVSLHRRGETLRPEDHTVRLRKVWAKTLVGPNDVVLVTQLPLGGGSNGQTKAIGGAVALLALALAVAAAPLLLPAGFALSGVSAFALKALSTGLILGASYLLSKATQPKANDGDQLYGVSGGGNLPRPGDRIPALYGEGWTKPDLTQPAYTVYDGEDQVLYQRMTVGLGEHEIVQIDTGVATIWTLAGGVQAPFNAAPGGGGTGEMGHAGNDTGTGRATEVEIINPGETSELVPETVYSSPSVGGTELPRTDDVPAYAGPFEVCPPGEQTTLIQLDYSLPNGVYKTHNGAQSATFYGVSFEWAPCDVDGDPTGPFTLLWVDSKSIKSTKALRFTKQITVPLGRYVVRAQNTADEEDGDDTFTNNATWDGLRSHFGDAIIRPHVTEIALRIRSGKALGVTAFSEIWVKYRRKVRTWNGTSWVLAASRKAVYAYLDALTSTYGGNLNDNEVDLERIKFYASELTEHDTFDGVIRGPVSLWEAGSVILGPIRGEPARIGNLWSLRRDEQRSIKKHVFTRRQIVRGSTSASYKIARDDGAADVILEYSPDGDPRRRREVRVTFGAQSLTPRRLQGQGISNYEDAHHLATWMAAVAYFRRKPRRLTSELQGRLVQRGDPVVIDAWFQSNARAAGVLSRSGLNLSLDTAVDVPAGTYALFRDRKGREWGPVLITAGTAPNRIVLDAADVAAAEDNADLSLSNVLALDTEDQTSVLIGPFPNSPYLVSSVIPQSQSRIAIEAVNDAPEVWEALGEPPPDEPPIPSRGDEDEPDEAIVPWVRAQAVQKTNDLVMEWAVGRARGAASYVVKLSYDDGITWEDVSNGIDPSGSYTLRHEEGIDVKVGAYAVSKKGVAGPSVYTTFTTFSPTVDPGDIVFDIDWDQLGGPIQDSLARLAEIARIVKEQQEKIADVVAGIAARQWVETDSLRHGVRLVHEDLSASVEQVYEVARDLDSALAKATLSLDATVTNLNGTITNLNAHIQVTGLAFASRDFAFAQYQIAVSTSLTLKNTVYVQAAAPSAPTAPQLTFATNDVWFDTDDGNREYRWNGSSWVALPNLNRNRTFVQASPPTAEATGDIWVDSDDSNLVYIWDGDSWEPRRDGNLTTLITAGVVTNASSIVTNSAAFAAWQNTVNAQFGSISAFVNQSASAYALATGAAGALWVLSLGVGGLIGGVKLGNDGSVITAVWEVTQFVIKGPAGLGNVIPFAVDVANNRVLMNSNVYIQSLVANSVNAGHINVSSLSAVSATMGFVNVGSNIQLDGPNGRILVTD
jgi:hypothetical protein